MRLQTPDSDLRHQAIVQRARSGQPAGIGPRSVRLRRVIAGGVAASLAVGGVIFASAGAFGATPAAAVPVSSLAASAELADQNEQADVAPVVSSVSLNQLNVPTVFG